MFFLSYITTRCDRIDQMKNRPLIVNVILCIHLVEPFSTAFVGIDVVAGIVGGFAKGTVLAETDVIALISVVVAAAVLRWPVVKWSVVCCSVVDAETVGLVVVDL